MRLGVWYRRARGIVLRLVRAPVTAVATGVALAAASGCLLTFDLTWESWVTDGLGLVLGGTGVALIVAGLGGRRPDWIDSG